MDLVGTSRDRHGGNRQQDLGDRSTQGRIGSCQHARRPARSEYARGPPFGRCCCSRACRAIPRDPEAGPGHGQSAPRWAVHWADQASESSRAISWRTMGSRFLPLAIARSITRSTRPARLRVPRVGGGHPCVFGGRFLPGPADGPWGTGGRQGGGASRRSWARVVRATVHPCPTSPITLAAGTRASVRNTSLNEAWPFIWRNGLTSMPGWCMGRAK